MQLQQGWYPDYTQPGTERWHNGAEWTSFVRSAAAQPFPYQQPADHVAPSGASMPWQTVQPADPPRSRRLLYGFVGVLAVMGALSLWGWLSSSGSLNIPTSLSSYDCESLAAEAVVISEGEFVQLLDVREPQIVEDHRQDYELPTGTDEALVLKCEGLGVWSHGWNSTVDLRLTVDADGDAWIRYQDLGVAGPH